MMICYDTYYLDFISIIVIIIITVIIIMFYCMCFNICMWHEPYSDCFDSQ